MAMKYLTYIERNPEMNDIPSNLIYSPELDRWLDSSPPLSDDDIRAMSAYFDSESFQLPNCNFYDIIKS